MMLIKTHLAPSDIDGIGIFASEDVEQGRVIWRLNLELDRILKKSYVETLPEVVRNYIDLYGHDNTDDRTTIFIDFDNGRFMNHSDEPNADFSTPHVGYAKRAIRKGEELTCDYREFQESLTLLDPNSNFSNRS